MKQIILAIIKCAIVVSLLYTVGIFKFVSMIWHSSKEPSNRYYSHFRKNLPVEESQRRDGILCHFIKAKVQAAKQRAATYGPKEYYQDMEDIRKKEVELQRIAWGMWTMEFAFTRDEIWQKTGRKIDRREFRIYSNELERKYPNGLGITDPEEEIRPKNEWDMTWLKEIIWWLFIKYLTIMPFIVALLLVWKFEISGDFKLRSPGRFLLCALFYPHFIHRYFSAKVEMRRTKEYVTDILSVDEIAQVKAFVLEKSSLKEFRADLYERQQRTARHSYLKVITCMLLLTLLCCRSGFSMPHWPTQDKRERIYQLTVLQYDTDGSTYHMHTYDGTDTIAEHMLIPYCILPDPPLLPSPPLLVRLIHKAKYLLYHAQECIRSVEHIPLCYIHRRTIMYC